MWGSLSNCTPSWSCLIKLKKMFADTSTSQAIVCQCTDLTVSKKVLVGIILCG